MDFGKVAKVTKIGTQGRYNVGQWITKYIVSYSIDGGFFEYQLHKPYYVPRVSITNEAVLRLVYKVYLGRCFKRKVLFKPVSVNYILERQVHNNFGNVSKPIGHPSCLYHRVKPFSYQLIKERGPL